MTASHSSKCPNCGRLLVGHDFNLTPGPVQAETARLREQLKIAKNGLMKLAYQKVESSLRSRDAAHVHIEMQHIAAQTLAALAVRAAYAATTSTERETA